MLFVSCNQYEKPNTEILDSQTVEAIQNATKEFLKNPENFKPQKKVNNNNESYLDVLLKEAIKKICFRRSEYLQTRCFKLF